MGIECFQDSGNVTKSGKLFSGMGGRFEPESAKSLLYFQQAKYYGQAADFHVMCGILLRHLNTSLSSFRRRPESRKVAANLNLWMPDQVRHDGMCGGAG